MTTLPDTEAVFWRLMEAIAQDGRPCLMNRMYQTAEEREGYAKHMAFMVAGAMHRQRLFMAGNRVGKCNRNGTLVATPTGYTKIEDLRIGDIVFAETGEQTRVIGVYPQGEVDIYRLDFDGHTPVYCCGEHLWKYLPPKARYPMRHSHGKWEPNPSYGKWTVGRTSKLMALNLARPKQRPVVPMTGAFDIEKKSLPVDPYTLGALLGDGCMSNGTVVLACPDREIPAHISQHYEVVERKVKGCPEFSIRGAVADMRALGLQGCRAWEKFIPEQYLYSSAECRLALLRGLMDTDGSAHGNGAVEFSTTSDALCDGVMWLCASLGMKARRYQRQTKHQNGLGRLSWRVIIRSGEICPFLLSRKRDCWICTKETHDWVLHSITPAGRAQATCIEVDHPSHTYVLEHGIVTHNTEGAGGYELALHLTGRYPDWWQGRRFDKPVIAWAAGDTRETTRDILQAKIIGQRGKLQECKALVHPSYIAGTNAGFIPDSFSSVKVRHTSGELSVVYFKSYDQGREAFQGTEVDVILLDEEPPLNVYLECLTRTMTNNGMVMLTFTPLRGMSETVQSFFPDGDVSEGVINGRHVTMAGWDDAPHLTEEAKQEMLATYPPFMRLARSRGLPQMGAGVIYPVDQERYKIDPIEIPEDWRRCYGLDVGWNCTAAVFGAYDDDSGCWYIYSEHTGKEATPLENTHGIKGRGDWIPGVIDPASEQRNQKDGTKLIEEYQDLGLDLTTADNSVETGITRVWTLLSTGKLKIFSNCVNLLRELRGYIRDEKGKVVKQNDHCFVAGTLVKTLSGDVPIENLVGKRFLVVTQGNSLSIALGARLTRKDTPVIMLLFSDGSEITCTPEHLFMTDEGWVQAQDLCGLNVTTSEVTCKSELSSYLTSSRNFLARFTGSAASTFKGMASVFTESFTNTTMGKFRRVFTSTILTETGATTSQKTSFSCPNQSTCPCTHWKEISLISLKPQEMPPQYGTGRRLELIGTKSITRTSSTGSTKSGSTHVSSAENYLKQWLGRTVFARITVSLRIVERAALTMLSVPVWFVGRFLFATSTASKKHVQENAVQCVRLSSAGKADVYCLEVPLTHSFALGNGAIVHNCVDALRYLCMSGPDVARTKPLPMTRRQNKNWVA